MATNPRDRLGRLFANQPLPAPPTPGQRHFSEKELEQKKANDEEALKIPSTAQYPRQIKAAPQVERNVDILTSSDDDDDYVAAFQKKPSMKSPTGRAAKLKPRVMPEPNAFGYPKDTPINPEGPIECIAKSKASIKNTFNRSHFKLADSPDGDLPTSSKHGKPVTGHFCQFNLVAKFPYKYMNDTNDRVSRHFFAANKFYDRTWDMQVIPLSFTPMGSNASTATISTRLSP